MSVKENLIGIVLTGAVFVGGASYIPSNRNDMKNPSETRHVKDLLTELRSGKEINWDYIPRHVDESKITRTKALGSLKRSLYRLIPEYKRMAKAGDSRYWGKRLEKAELALQLIKEEENLSYLKINNKIVEFRGIKL